MKKPEKFIYRNQTRLKAAKNQLSPITEKGQIEVTFALSRFKLAHSLATQNGDFHGGEWTNGRAIELGARYAFTSSTLAEFGVSAQQSGVFVKGFEGLNSLGSIGARIGLNQIIRANGKESFRIMLGGRMNFYDSNTSLSNFDQLHQHSSGDTLVFVNNNLSFPRTFGVQLIAGIGKSLRITDEISLDLGYSMSFGLTSYMHNKVLWEINGEVSPPEFETYSSKGTGHAFTLGLSYRIPNKSQTY